MLKDKEDKEDRKASTLMNHESAKNKWTWQSFLLFNYKAHFGSQKGQMWEYRVDMVLQRGFYTSVSGSVEKNQGRQSVHGKAKWQKVVGFLNAEKGKHITIIW